MGEKGALSLWMRMKDRWRLWGPWRRTLMLLNIVLILNLLLMLGAWLLHPLIIVIVHGPSGPQLALVIRFPFLWIFVLAIVGSTFSAIVTPLGQFPEMRFRLVALFICSWLGTITYLVCLYFQNLWVLTMSPLVGNIPSEPYPGYWVHEGLLYIVGSHLNFIPMLMLLGFFGMIFAYILQYVILS